MCSGAGDWTCLQPGFPIRKSLDHSSVTSSPRLIAGSYVLLRLLVPRHPPCALINLNQRCSRPLCSSQGTGGDRPLVRCLLASASGSAGGRSARNGPVLVYDHRGAAVAEVQACRPVPQDPTVCQGS